MRQLVAIATLLVSSLASPLVESFSALASVSQVETAQSTPHPTLSRSVAHTGVEFAESLGIWNSQRNEMISPLSLQTALGMLMFTSENEVEERLHSFLLGDEPSEDLFRETEEFLVGMEANHPDAVQFASSLWFFKDFTLDEAVADSTIDTYRASIYTDQTANGATLRKMNDWVHDHTKGRIPRIFRQVDPDWSIVLLNATTFDGEWLKPFDKGKTRSEPFVNPLGSRNVEMMLNTSEWPYGSTEEYEAVVLPYHGPFEMTVVLPQEGRSVAQVMPGFLENKQAVRAEMNRLYGTVRIPRFKFSSSYNLMPALRQIRLPMSFATTAGFFTRLTPTEITQAPTSAIHKAFIETDEEGTRAAAATGVATSLGGGSPEEKFEFVADRPFGFVITETDSDVVLYLGVVNDPTS